jgi:16S rRNA (uracil1498-N3)-methyltransferase
VNADVFYCPPGKIGRDSLVIDGEEFSHLVHVMRKKEGDPITAVDGKGNAWDAVITKLGQRSALCAIGPARRHHREPELRVTLAAAVLKNPSRYDFLVEKTVELGVSEIIPMRTGRTIPSHARSGRWRKLALAAMKQSGRSFLPPVRDLTNLGDVLEEFGGWANAVVAHEDPSAGEPYLGLRHGEQGGPRLLLLVGPEGGFSPEEIGECLRRNFRTLCLGERRLRAETAAVAALAVLMR